ncbi:alpha/beta hydrolase [Mycobacterium sp. PS03-16]|uniref:alpha/beta hydrolase n=1 Tax=Mycobacterium sp. PS03-16 TaxID=2559611 RepID=UPI0010748A84|nr:alpha/beta hydrolase [Mycobacterium sp. PS03-16]TFV55730.1 alpha/beta hydrolase [Mycobacterium sp. PS03-16]
MPRPQPLLTAAAELLNAANGVQPLGRQGYITLPTFAFGWPTSELAPLYLTGSVLDTARRAWRGHFTGTGGRIALALKAITWVLLVVIQRRNVRSEPHFDAGLRETLGEEYASVARTSQPADKARKRAGVFGTGWSRRRYVEKAGTVRYGPHRANTADIWRRGDLPRDGRAPVLLQVPGGAWAIGMRRPQAYPLLSHMSERGWICVSIGYRISPRHTWPAHIVDVKRALAWIRENIADYGGDPDFVAITGGSAGGHLAALAALTPNDPQWQPGFADADTSVVAAVPVYGRYDWYTTEGSGRPQFIGFLQKFVVKKSFLGHRRDYLEASPLTKLRPDAPPFFVLHGTDDSIIPVPEGREFVEELRKVSKAPVAYSEIPHAQHAFDFFGSPRGHYTAEAIERFLSWVHARRG